MIISDSELRRLVEEELAFEPSVDATHIGVTAHEGVVTLSGHVSSHAQKVAAERAVGRVRGVRAIAETLDVRLPTDKKRSDEEIAERAVRLLQWDDLVPSSEVHVKVERGWVTLSGKVTYRYQQEAAVRDVRRLSGVVGVTNLIAVAPAPVVSSSVRSQIESAFKRQAELEARNLMVNVEGSRVTLTGKVESMHERNTAVQAAWSTAGVTAVDDRMMVA
jgi:osmotically-inducible protein OsmY